LVKHTLAVVIFGGVGAIGTETSCDSARKDEIGDQHHLSAHRNWIQGKLSQFVAENSESGDFISHFKNVFLGIVIENSDISDKTLLDL
jgi:hypothetical protein